MKTIIALMLLCSVANAQQKTSFKFDFGNGEAAIGYIPVTVRTIYTDALGYGFINPDEEELIGRALKPYKKNKSITVDNIGSSKPFFFSVKLPEGNYDVKVTLGGSGTSATTVRAECRRLFLQNIITKAGEIRTETFTVHVKDSLIRDAKGTIIDKVKLKEREINYLHWDNQLTLEFNDTASRVCAIEITPNTKATTIFLSGNSTVVDQDREPWASWGQMIPSFFEGKNICIANYAESGETLSSFKSAKRLQKLLSLMKAGDYLFIEFGHNDMKQKGEGIGPFTSYKASLKYFISETRKKGGIPVLVTSMNRRTFDSTGHITNSLGDYPEAVRQTAKEENVALVDLNAMSKIMYEAWGPEKSIKAFVHYPANTFPNQDKKLEDNTHFNTYGAYEICRCIVQSIQDNKLPIAKYLKKGITKFNPAEPDAVEKWYWPQSVLMAAVKPDGN
ncbi:rhamnogalacturonan acetylesterase [Ferruginibacter sp. SUN106]|uniref:rhamnogalacturonan acetylesterase n=1 Tax=Ferruginibacter sp. SUN106 TaxID=2978348 RepID=UPI003D35E129